VETGSFSILSPAEGVISLGNKSNSTRETKKKKGAFKGKKKK